MEWFLYPAIGALILHVVQLERPRREAKRMKAELDRMLAESQKTAAALMPPVAGQLVLPVHIVAQIQGAAFVVCHGRAQAVETKIQGMNHNGVVDLRMLTASAEVFERVIHPALVAAFPHVFGGEKP